MLTMKAPAHSELLDAAVSAARTAGDYALENFGRRREVVSTARHDVKLRLDLECQQQVESIVGERFPDHAVLGEESETGHGTHGQASDYQWVIDPIDGTVNFTHGLRHWCCSVAVQFRGESVAAAVYAPALDEVYTATADGKALLNEAEIQVSGTEGLDTAMVLTGMDKGVDPQLPPYAIFTRIAMGARKTRIMGSAALDMCQVACGRADGYFEAGIYTWDVAAASLIVKRAGGEAEALRRLADGRLCFLASNGHIHGDLARLIQLPDSHSRPC